MFAVVISEIMEYKERNEYLGRITSAGYVHIIFNWHLSAGLKIGGTYTYMDISTP